MITLLAILIPLAAFALLWQLAKRFDSRYRDGGVKFNVKRVGR